MKITKTDIFWVLGTFGLTILIIKIMNRKKSILVKGSYTVPENIPYRQDALHSFESRKIDGFGGRMATEIRDKMKAMYLRGINPDVSDIEIKIDSKNYKVDWQATLKESTDGKAYLGISTVGSAGSDADVRAKSQIERMKTFVPNSKDYKLVKDFVNPTGVYIRQYFYKYTLPDQYPAHK